MSSKLVYRKDIDGLRGVAILMVLLYHAFPRFLPSGFIGVDLFFVISGYLITQIILNDLNNGDFKFSRFFARRVKRLFPALLLVLVCTLLMGMMVLYQEEFHLLVKHMLGVLSFSSNFVFLQEVGYFNGATKIKPLSSLWSLSVEEQYYLFWPGLLFCLHEFKSKFLPMIFLGVASFSLFLYLSSSSPNMAFYFPLSRSWEMVAGALIALPTRALKSPMRSFLSFLGVALSVVSLLIINQNHNFPGVAVLFPVAAACLLIAAGEDTWVNRRILSSKPLVLLGLFSYPLYLWHVPILSFARIILDRDPDVTAVISLLLLALILAWLTYRYIERPIRYGVGLTRPVTCLTSITLVLGLIVYNSYLSSSPLGKYSKGKLFSAPALNGVCNFLDSEDRLRCQVSESVRAPTMALIGDSHSYRLFDGIALKSSFSGENLVIMARFSCFPLFEAVELGINSVNCRKLMNAALNYVIQSSTIHTVFLSHRHSNAHLTNTYARSLALTLEKLIKAGKKVVFVHDIPQLDFNPHTCLRPRFGWPLSQTTKCYVDRKLTESWKSKMSVTVLGTLLQFPEVISFYPENYLCDKDRCWVKRDGLLLYEDDNHLSLDGGLWLGERIFTNKSITSKP